MKKFIFKVIAFGIVISIFTISFMYAIDYYGYSDYAYKRFTVGKQKSLILGTSRAAQAICPEIIDTCIKTYPPIYNFAFTVSDSPYGEIYYNAVTSILDSSTKDGLFILAVDPWALSTNENEISKYRESNSCLSKIRLCKSPNFEYLYHYFKLNDATWLTSSSHLSDRGQYKVIADYSETIVNRGIKQNVINYSNNGYIPSEYRLTWLQKTISMLREHGDVYLCRVPACNEMYLVENKIWPEFDNQMQSIAVQYDCHYFPIYKADSDYRTNDGNHLNYRDIPRFNYELCDSINYSKMK